MAACTFAASSVASSNACCAAVIFASKAVFTVSFVNASTFALAASICSCVFSGFGVSPLNNAFTASVAAFSFSTSAFKAF